MSWRFRCLSAVALSTATWFVPQVVRAQEALVPPVQPAETAASETSVLLDVKETLLTVAFHEHLNDPQSRGGGQRS